MRLEHFITCSPGVEPILHAEVKALRLSNVEQQVGGVRFIGSMHDAWRANLELRTAIRVLQRLDLLAAPDADELYKHVLAVDWRKYLREDGTFFVDAQCRESELDHSQFVAQRTKDGVVDFFRKKTGKRPSVAKEDADLRIHVHIWKDRATLSVDTSGNSLHKRGWRKYQGLAPLSETLSAAMVLHSGWNRRSPVVDPFCGSGTLLIEAALLAADHAPGLFRSFGFENWPIHDLYAYGKLREVVASRIKMPRKLQLVGCDIEHRHLAGIQANAESAGVADLVRVEQGDALEFPWKRGWNAQILSNLPYGMRVGDLAQITQLHRDFGKSARDQCAGYRVALLVGSRQLTNALGFKTWDEIPIQNGPIPCRLLTTEL